MAKLPTQRRVLREDVKDAPSWIENVLNPLNSFMDSVYRALNRSLTFQDNITSEIRTLRFQTRSDYTSAIPLTAGFEPLQFVHSLKSKPFGLFIAQIEEVSDTYVPFTSAVTLSWYEANGTVFINYITGLSDSKNYKLTVLLI